MMILSIPDLETTMALGKSLGPLLFPGAVVALIGPLGAGKTTFVRAVAEGMGVKNLAAVNSPTFTLIHEYGNSPKVFHIDLYRLESEREVESLGLDELFDGDALVLIEWGERFPRLMPRRRTEIRLRAISEDAREIAVSYRTE